jgi:MYXO-CTERM domain-containing protein
MNNIKLGTRTLALAVCLSCALPLAAQTTTGSGGTSATTGTDTTRRESGFDWGWLGLIGLAGLLGKRRNDVHATTPRTTTTSR